MGVAVLVSTGCTMPPWRGKQTAKHDATHEYIERTAADIQYDTHAIAVVEAEAAQSTDLKVGIFNPDLPDAPAETD